VNLNVHHKKPFHLFPQLELEPTNLITLCMESGKDCHIKLGHGDNFKAYNPNVEEDVNAVAKSFNTTLLEEYAVKVKKAALA
jgi:5-methylcytosine-specific restriction endonuclease McrA